MVIINDRFELNLEKNLVKDHSTNHLSRLGVNEAELLSYFLSHPNTLLSKKELIDNIWTKRGVIVEESSLMNALSCCRKAFSDKNGEVIKTERGKGYRFIGEIANGTAELAVDDSQVQKPVAVPSTQAKVILNSSERAPSKFISRKSFNVKWLSIYAIGSVISLILGHEVKISLIDSLLLGKTESYSLVRYDSCTYKGKVDNIKLGSATVVTLKGISIAINGDFKSVSFPSSLTESYCE